MDGGKCGNMGSGVLTPGRIFKSVPPDRLCRPDDVAPSEVAVFTAFNAQCWASLCTAGGGIVG